MYVCMYLCICVCNWVTMRGPRARVTECLDWEAVAVQDLGFRV